MSFRPIVAAGLATACLVAFILPSEAGTTGGIAGLVLESSTHIPIADANISATSPSQNASTTTNAAGRFIFISLAPETYTVTASKNGFNAQSAPGVTVISDQTRTVTIVLEKALRVIGSVTVRGSESLVRPGTTSNVFSINAAGQKATAALAGAGGLNQAYGAIASAPGVVYQQGQQGWYQSVYIRGGDIDQVAYELDGIPVQRVSDSAPVATLTNLGQAEVQVYTGGTPASAEASGIAGYVNQVIRTGTYPGFSNITLGVGAPALYNKGLFEVGGAAPDRRFNYYVGVANAAQTYRYGDQNNNAGNPLFFFPLLIPSMGGSGIFDGSAPAIFAPGQTYAIAKTSDQEAIGNFHYGIPHKNDSGKDDIQLLYVYSGILQNFYSSQNDLGLNDPATLFAVNGGPINFFDIPVYQGNVFAPPDASRIVTQLFPNTGLDRPAFAPIPLSQREGSQNGMTLIKLQYQRNIDSKTYLRLYGSSNYNWWFISGPVSANLVFGDQLPDYEVIGHNWNATGIFSRQLNDKHLINFTASYMTGKLQTYSMGFFDGFMTNLVDTAGNCYDGATGAYSTCFDTTAGSTSRGCFPAPTQPNCTTNLTPAMPGGGPAVANGAQWIITENGQNAQIDNVRPDFVGVSLTDQWRPGDRTTISAGLRVESFKYTLQDLASGYPARAFWFAAYNRENCFGAGQTGPTQVSPDPITGAPGACPPGTTHTNLVNYAGGTTNDTVFEPRLAFTQALSPDTVIRGSYGRYARPAPTSYLEFNTTQQNLPGFIGSFLAFGYNSPFHETHADIANNYDLSFEHHFPGTDMALKITPYLRATQNQIQYLSLNAQGVVDGLNVGRQRSQGVEFAFTKGSFARDGLAVQLAATYTRSRIRYGNFPNGLNIIDLLNQTVQNYNGFTSACAGSTSAQCTTTGVASTNAVACFTPGSPATPDPTCLVPGDVANPYFGSMPQPLFDRNGEYTTYDQIPAPFNNAIGFETPFQASLVVNYKHGRFSVAPNLTYSTQGKYGSPLVWPGYDPTTCSGVVSGTTADPTTCSGFFFIPDKYTGRFDNLGAFAQPQRLSAGIQFGYDVSAHVNATLTLANLVDTCFQHHNPWDNSSTCAYAQLASNLLAPAGNFVANPPAQLAFPYGNWYNNIEIGQEGQRSPMQAVLELHIKI